VGNVPSQVVPPRPMVRISGVTSRSEREPGVAAHGEHAHAAGAAATGDVVGVAGRFGVKGGDADPRDRDRGERERVGGHNAGKSDAGPPDE
jgi:hypothetical protein